MEPGSPALQADSLPSHPLGSPEYTYEYFSAPGQITLMVVQCLLSAVNYITIHLLLIYFFPSYL